MNHFWTHFIISCESIKTASRTISLINHFTYFLGLTLEADGVDPIANFAYYQNTYDLQRLLLSDALYYIFSCLFCSQLFSQLIERKEKEMNKWRFQSFVYSMIGTMKFTQQIIRSFVEDDFIVSENLHIHISVRKLFLKIIVLWEQYLLLAFYNSCFVKTHYSDVCLCVCVYMCSVCLFVHHMSFCPIVSNEEWNLRCKIYW